MSALVDIITPPLLAPLDESRRNPTSVTVTMEFDARVAFEMTITIDVDVGAVAIADGPPLMATTGELPRAKNPEENISFM